MTRQNLQGRRIALFSGNYNYTRDGACQVLNRWVAHLEAAYGCDVRVYSPTSGSPAFAPAGTLVTVPSLAIPFRPDYRIAVGLPPAARADLARFEPDLIHLSTPDLLGWQALKAARSLGVPVVASIHTRFETYLRYYGLGAFEPFLKAWVRAFYGRCDYVLAPSGVVAEEMLGDLAGRVRLWGRGVDRDLFNPARRDSGWRDAHDFNADDVIVLFFGRLVKEKGLAVLADALDLAAERDRRVRGLVVGSGPAKAWLARRLPNAVFTGTLVGEQLATAVASADIMFNPSVTETFGSVTLEAMACGLPVVAAAVPAHRALVTTSAGRLCRPGDAEEFADAIMRLVRDRPLRKALGAGGRTESARYGWSDVLERGASVYNEAMAATAITRKVACAEVLTGPYAARRQSPHA